MARRKKAAVKRTARRQGVQINHEGRRYKKGTRNVRATHGGHAGQKGGWLGALFSGLMGIGKAVLPHALSAGAQIGAQAAAGEIAAKRQEAMQRRQMEQQKKMQMERERREREMYGLDD